MENMRRPVLGTSERPRSRQALVKRLARATATVLAALVVCCALVPSAWGVDDFYFTDSEGNILSNGDAIDADVLASGFVLYVRVPSADDGHGGSIRTGGWLVKYGDTAISMTPDKYTESFDGYYTVIRVHPMQVPNVGTQVQIRWEAQVHQTYPTLEDGEPLWRDPDTGATYKQSLTKVDPSSGATYIEVPSEDGSSVERVYLRAVTYTEFVGSVEAEVSLIVGGQTEEEGEDASVGDEAGSEAGGDLSGSGGGGSTGGGDETQAGGGVTESTFASGGADIAESVETPEVAYEAVSSVERPAEVEAEAEEQGLAFTGVQGALSASELVGLGRVYGLEGASSSDAVKGDPAEIQAEEVFVLLRVLSSLAFAILLALVFVFGVVQPIVRYRRGLGGTSRFFPDPSGSEADGAPSVGLDSVRVIS